VGTEHARRGPVHGHLGERGNELVLGRRDEGRLVRRHSALEQPSTGAAVSLGIGGEEVDAGEAVHLQIDEPRRSDPVPVAGAEPDSRDETVRHLDVTRNKGAVDERCPDAEPHAYPATPATA